MNDILDDLKQELDFLIDTIANTYEKDELLNLSGRIYELNKIIKKLEGVGE